MTERKHTDEEVIKALGNAIETGDAPIGVHWACTISKQTAKDALDLINRQKAEREGLIINMNAARLGMIAEHERLKTARAEAIKEFADRLKRKLIANGIYPVLVKNSMEKLLKEMTEENGK